ncbi:MAG: CRISPR-associated RAMP protein Csx7 [Bacillota bacterium]
MYKYRLCCLALDIRIEPWGPVLVKSPKEGSVDPAIPDMSFVRTHSPHPEGPRETVYLPGSSLKGVFRSYCEGISRAVGLPVCNPFDEKSPCRKEEKENPYKESCHICRLFGSTQLGGRISISDAYPTKETIEKANKTNNRTGVGIDRLLGSSLSGALYDYEVVERGSFQAHIRLENFELWQVGLLALALRALDAGHLRIGHGTSRGMGFVKVSTHQAEVRYTGLTVDEERSFRNRAGEFPLLDDKGECLLYGVAELLPEKEAEAYGMSRGDSVHVAGVVPDSVGLEVSVMLKKEKADSPPNGALEQFFGECVKRFSQEADPKKAGRQRLMSLQPRG